MTSDTNKLPNVSPTTAAPPGGNNRRWLLYGCGTLLALVLLIVATVALTLWWIQRPIKPVVLSAPEKATVEAKLQPVTGGNAAHRGPDSSPNRSTKAVAGVD